MVPYRVKELQTYMIAAQLPNLELCADGPIQTYSLPLFAAQLPILDLCADGPVQRAADV